MHLPSWQRARDLVFPVVAVTLLLLQGLAILRKPFVEERFFCWSPHDARTDLRLTVTRNGIPVAGAEAAHRYGLLAVDWHSPGNVKRVIRTAESRHPEDPWRIILEYRRNLGSRQVWTYP